MKLISNSYGQYTVVDHVFFGLKIYESGTDPRYYCINRFLIISIKIKMINLQNHKFLFKQIFYAVFSLFQFNFCFDNISKSINESFHRLKFSYSETKNILHLKNN